MLAVTHVSAPEVVQIVGDNLEIPIACRRRRQPVDDQILDAFLEISSTEQIPSFAKRYGSLLPPLTSGDPYPSVTEKTPRMGLQLLASLEERFFNRFIDPEDG